MKILISHDVDHLHVSEHYADLVVPKFLVRALLELFSAKISFHTFFRRHLVLFTNRWHRIPELCKFNIENQVPSTFFFGMSKGKGMVYSNNKAHPWIKYVLDKGFDAGVHGIAFDVEVAMRNEHQLFKNLSGKNQFGIRMHYLRQNENTFSNMEKAGYVFDSSKYELNDPYKMGTMWEFPLSLMEGYLFENGKPWQTQSLEQVKKKTIEILKEAENKNVHYFSVLFHDRYFDTSFYDWKQWYMWFVEYVKERKYTFISYSDAIKELEKVNS